MYALNYDTEGNFFKMFKPAINDRFEELTCVDAALIDNRIDKGRNFKAEDIKTIIRETFKDST